MPPVTPKVVSTPTITVQNKFTANFSSKDSSYEIEKFYSPKFFKNEIRNENQLYCLRGISTLEEN